jgi:hypothetical protein
VVDRVGGRVGDKVQPAIAEIGQCPRAAFVARRQRESQAFLSPDEQFLVPEACVGQRLAKCVAGFP